MGEFEGGVSPLAGYFIARWYTFWTLNTVLDLFSQMPLPPLSFIVMWGSLGVGSILIAGYVSLNLLRAVLGNRPRQRWLGAILVVGALGLLIGSLLLGVESGWRLVSRTLWGYGLVWLAIGSNLAAEVAERRHSQASPDRHLTPGTHVSWRKAQQ
jgi:hypothetical protein